VWAEVAQRSYEETELNWTYLSFLTLATVIAAIAIVLDSQILVIGAMVLGPEFGAIVALGVALVRRRFALLALATRTLILGFMVAIVATTISALIVGLWDGSPSKMSSGPGRPPPSSSTPRTSGRLSSRSSRRRPESYHSHRERPAD
jgi:Domain of unknown function (DUF389)